MDSNKRFTVQFGCLVAYRGKDRHVVIPDGVTVIGRRAFFGNRELQSVWFPASVSAVEQEAFAQCPNLETVTVTGKIKKVGNNAFGDFFGQEALELSVCSAIPIGAFTKSAQEDVLRAFSRRFSEFIPGSDVFRDNLRFIGMHLKQPQDHGSNLYYHYLTDNDVLRHAVLNAETIPAKDIDWLVAALQAEGNTAFVVEILAYRNRLLSDEKKQNTTVHFDEEKTKKALSAEPSVADWRRLLRFSYEDGAIVIQEVKIREPVVILPDHIGVRKVRVIGFRAFSYNRKPGETALWSPEKIILPEGIEEIRSAAFFCCENTEIFFPTSLKALPGGCFCAVKNLTLHIPDSVVQIADYLGYDSENPFKAICAHVESYAEQYAKEHNIPFVAE